MHAWPSTCSLLSYALFKSLCILTCDALESAEGLKVHVLHENLQRDFRCVCCMNARGVLLMLPCAPKPFPSKGFWPLCYGRRTLSMRCIDASEVPSVLPCALDLLSSTADLWPVTLLQRNFGRVRCVDATEVPYPAHHRRAPLKGWALKAFALHATKYATEL